MNDETVRKQWIFSGRVQGVGFRYTCKRIADMLGMTGYVKNLDDGTVLAEIQGTQKQLVEFLKELKKSRWIYVDDIRSKDLEVIPESKFEYRY